jgi:hypothetical protein
MDNDIEKPRLLNVIGLDDLITIKLHINRPKDQAALFQLEAPKRLRQSKAGTD